MDTAAANELIEDATPALLGEFTPQTLSFTTTAAGMPILNSLPGSPTSVFLDFDGDITTNTQAYDVDSTPTTFNTAEQKTIAEAWRHIATYYAMFDTNVTTIEPPVAQPKVWAAIGNNITGGYCGVNVFPNTQPRCFNQSSDARTRQSGIAHEVGHNFGLSHQSDFDLFGFETADYSRGYDELHVPIMGVDFAPRVRKFIVGHTGNASALQDDISVISSKIKPYQPTGGDGFRADDYSGTIATATALTLDSDVQYVSGIIERMTDVDVFSFTSSGLPMTILAAADTPSGLDVTLDIYDAAGNRLAAADGPLNDQEITITLPVGTYYASVASHENYGDVGTYNLTVRKLPTGWTSQDVGAVGLPGFSQFNSTDSSFTLGASGADVAGTADEMQFAMQTLTGDGTIIAKVNSITNTNTNSMAGIAIRETTAGNARHVSLAATYSSGFRFTRRTTVCGTATTTTTSAAAFAPVWVRLTRVGNVFTASSSPNGTTWTQVGTPQTVAMGATVQIGLMASARNDTAINVAVFDNVSVTGTLGTTPSTPNLLSAPTGVTVTRSTGSDLTVAWANQADETGYRVERSTDGIVFTSAGTTSVDVTSFVDASLTGSMRYFYRVLALDAAGASFPSTVISEINRPSAVTRLELTSTTQTQIVLDWIETSGEIGYRIERSSDGITYTTLGSVAANIPSYTNNSLTNATTYFYRVTPTSSLGDGVPAIISGATRMAQVTNLAFTSIVGNSIALTWTDITTETGYLVQRSTNGTSFSDLTTLAAGTVTYTDTTVTVGNEYYYRVLGTDGASRSLFNLVFTASPTITALPSPWIANDIGTVSGSGVGSTTYTSSSTTFKVVSSGTAISGTTDSFRFTHQRMLGDGSITARVASLEDTNGGSTRFGVMFRESLVTGSRFAMMALRQGNTGTAQFSSRASVGSTATSASDLVRKSPYWVRVTRAGNLFTGATSSDGVTWADIGSATIAMPSLVYFGLAASSGISTLLNTATATNVSVVGDTRNATIAGRQVFYNNASGFGTSGANNAPTVNPTIAIDTTKIALLPGQAATVNSYTNNTQGLNGIVIDLNSASNLTGIDASSFQFASWNGSASAGFAAISPSVTVSAFVTGGTGGSGRVKLVFADNAIRNTWLRVTVLANATTGLLANDVFYFGNATGDMKVGNSGSPIMVQTNESDTTAVRQNLSPIANSAIVTNVYDVNKDGRVNALDVSLVRQNETSRSIRFFTAPTSLRFAITPTLRDAPDASVPGTSLSTKSSLANMAMSVPIFSDPTKFNTVRLRNREAAQDAQSTDQFFATSLTAADFV